MFPPLLPKLTADEQAIARIYWNGLLFPSSSHAYYASRDGLKEQNRRVFDAVMCALVFAWRQDNLPTPEENPFKG